MIDEASRAFLIMGTLYANNVLYEIRPKQSARANLICAALNATLRQMMTNLDGRTNFGGGMLELAAYEVSGLHVVNPALLGEIDETIFASDDWGVLNPPDARRALDAAVFDALGLTVGERDAALDAVRELAESRLRRAGSAR